MPGNVGGGGGGEGAKYTFVLCRGNYSSVVRAALARRPWWRDAVLDQCGGGHARATISSTETSKKDKKHAKTTIRTTASQRKLLGERQDAVAKRQAGSTANHRRPAREHYWSESHS